MLVPRPGDPAATWVAEFEARTPGELFVYVNDSVIGLPWLGDVFYRNNPGTDDRAWSVCAAAHASSL